jgi:hypothetical protein
MNFGYPDHNDASVEPAEARACARFGAAWTAYRDAFGVFLQAGCRAANLVALTCP